VKRERLTIVAAVLSIVCFSIPCLLVNYMPFHDDEFGVNQWDYPYVVRVLIAVAAVGLISACFAGARRSRRWYGMVLLNALLILFLYLGRGGF
jgi:hypothetical protein